jgi:hypothetical protein
MMIELTLPSGGVNNESDHDWRCDRERWEKTVVSDARSIR